jgi:hypothetical protein
MQKNIKDQKNSERQRRGRQSRKVQKVSAKYRRPGNPVLTSYFTIYDDIRPSKNFVNGTGTCITVNSH